MDKILSISVASYNLGDMIRENIQSFCDSEVANKIELLIIDDGSKDNTRDIVDEYVAKYPDTVKQIKKENGGPGSTVNCGIKNATGKYFRTVDGDDWVVTENLKEYVELLEKVDVDMVVSDYFIYDNRVQKCVEKKSFNISALKEFDFERVASNLPDAMHAICYKTEILQKNGVAVDNGFYTDSEYVMYPIKYVSSVCYFNKPIYVYRIGQATQSMSPEKLARNSAQHQKIFENIFRDYQENKNSFEIGKRKYIARKIANLAMSQTGIFLLLDCNRENKNKIKDLFKFVKSQDEYVFKFIKAEKKYKALSYSLFILYKFVAKKYKKKDSYA